MSLYLAQDVPAVAALSTLEKEQDRLTRAIEKKRRQARRPVLRSIVIAMRDFEIRPAEVLAAYQRLANGHDQAKYLDPATGRTAIAPTG